MRSLGFTSLVCVLGGMTLALPARAGNTLTVSDPTLDLPTIVTLGVQMLITGDDNFNATVSVRYKLSSSASDWKTGMPLFRVHPEQVQTNAPPAQFAGSIFDLAPATSYDIELHAVDPDGGDFTKTITGKTNPVPGDPPAPHTVNVTDQTSLQAAVTAAKPGDVIVLANGNYGPYLNVSASGAPGNPIVIRGASQAGVIFDGANCTCNAIEYYNTGNIHLENLTIQNVQRAVRVQSNDTTNNVFRYLHVKNVILGITTNANANGYYIADNIVEGRLVWPAVYKDDSGAHANDDGINIQGSGNVFAYNRISGFGDAMKTEADLTRSNDFYGNDVLWSYDNGLELDTSSGNTRAFRNRFTNNYAPTSFQPIFGGPTYLFRNVIVNVADEPFKLHALGGVSVPSGGLILHNTVVKAGSSLQLSTSDVAGNFLIENNLFVANPSDGYSVRWDTPIVDPTVTLDWNGYTPDGQFEFGYAKTGTNKTYASFADAVASGRFEQHGLLVGAQNFASNLATPSMYQPLLPPPDVTLASGSLAIDKGTVIPNLNDGFQGAAPDLGAYELGCPAPTYGPRAPGVDESNTSFACGSTTTQDGGTGSDSGTGGDSGTTGGDGGVTNPGSSGGCGCSTASPRDSLAALAAFGALIGLVARRRRRAV